MPTVKRHSHPKPPATHMLRSRPTGRKGVAWRKIIGQGNLRVDPTRADGPSHDYYLHATKGYRRVRA